MFDIGFSELIVIAIVALVVIGPERLPKVARTGGLLFGRLQRYVNDVKADISREMQLDELKKLQSEMQESARSFERSMTGEMQAIEQTVEQTVQSTQTTIQDFSAGMTEPVTADASNSVAAAATPTPVVTAAESGERTSPAGKG